MAVDDKNNGEDEYTEYEEDEDPRKIADDFFKDEDFEVEDYESDEEPSEGYRSKRVRQRQKKRKMIISTLLIMVILVAVAAGIVFGYRWIRNRFFTPAVISEEDRISVPGSLQLGEDMEIVIAGAGEDLFEPEVNSIIFSSYYSAAGEVKSLCIPVKTLMDIPGYGAELVGRTVGLGGMDLLRLTLEKRLGMDIEIDYYLLLDVSSIINKLGGINLVLDEEITVKNYDDGSTFKLEAGANLVDGAEAVNLLKFTSGIEKEVPIENVAIQKLVFDTLISEIVGKEGEDPVENLNLISSFIETELSNEDLLDLFTTFSGLEPAKNKVYTLEVSSTELEGEGIVYVPDVSSLAGIFAVTEAADEPASEEQVVSIKILNGVGTPGIAALVQEVLEGAKFEDGRSKYQVLEVGNADNMDYAATEIRVYAPEKPYIGTAAEDIKNLLAAGNVVTFEEEIVDSDIVIILGKDYSGVAVVETETVEMDQAVKINILNGEGTARLAATAKEILEDHFNAESKVLEVVETKDAANWGYTQSEIIVFTSNEAVEALAQQIQERLGVGTIQKSEDNPDNVDISVILGSDFTNQ